MPLLKNIINIVKFYVTSVTYKFCIFTEISNSVHADLNLEKTLSKTIESHKNYLNWKKIFYLSLATYNNTIKPYNSVRKKQVIMET